MEQLDPRGIGGAGTRDSTTFLAGDGVWRKPPSSGGGSGGGGIIAQLRYSPANPTLPTYTVATTAVTDVDATNLAVTFTAPASGSVLIRLSAHVEVSTANLSWALREGTTTVAGPMQIISGSTGVRRQTVEMRVDGLVAGQQYTYKWAWRSAGSTATGKMWVGQTGDAAVGPAFMTVEAIGAVSAPAPGLTVEDSAGHSTPDVTKVTFQGDSVTTSTGAAGEAIVTIASPASWAPDPADPTVLVVTPGAGATVDPADSTVLVVA